MVLSLPVQGCEMLFDKKKNYLSLHGNHVVVVITAQNIQKIFSRYAFEVTDFGMEFLPSLQIIVMCLICNIIISFDQFIKIFHYICAGHNLQNINFPLNTF